ncbi:MAG: hypothetical protein Kow0088_12650 [Anaerolineales bacterium]
MWIAAHVPSFQLSNLPQQSKLEQIQRLWQAQPRETRQHLTDQASRIVGELIAGKNRLQFSYPAVVSVFNSQSQQWEEISVPKRYQKPQTIELLLQGNLHPLQSLLMQLSRLFWSRKPAISVCTAILRYQIAHQLISQLPEEPTVSEAAAEEMSDLANLRANLEMLSIALAFEPAITESQLFAIRYQKAVQQLISRGRSYAQQLSLKMIQTLRQRAERNDLNRGVSVSVPYFDDQKLDLCFYQLQIIPPGRIPFEETYVVQAAQQAKQKVTHDQSLNTETRQHLYEQLDLLEKSFRINPHYVTVGMMFFNNRKRSSEKLSNQRQEIH